MKNKNNKKNIVVRKWLKLGRSGSSYWFIYSLAFLFILTILYIIFGEILHVYIYPTTMDLTGGQTVSADKWLGFWGFTPYIILLVIGLFLFFKLTQRDTQGE
jgi:hypothetical protein